MVYKGYREMKKLNRPIVFDEEMLRGMEDKYGLDREKLDELHIGKS